MAEHGNSEPWQGIRQRFLQASKAHPDLRAGLASYVVNPNFESGSFGPALGGTYCAGPKDKWRRWWFYDVQVAEACYEAHFRPDLRPDWTPDTRLQAGEQISLGIDEFGQIAEDAIYALREIKQNATIQKLREDKTDPGSLLGWLTVLFHIAWTRPTGSILRASRECPLGQMRELAYWGLSPGEGIQTEERAAIEKGLKEKIGPDDFVAFFPYDPFLASAYLIDHLFPGKPPSVKPFTPTSKGEKRAKWLAEAMLLVRDHPDWSDAAIAGRVGKSPSTLSRSREYQAAAVMARGSKDDRPRGRIVVDPESGLGDVEAYSDDPAERDWDE